MKPIRLITTNEKLASKRKKYLTETLVREIEETTKAINDKSHPLPSFAKESLEKRQKLLTETIPTFEHLYIRLKEKYKFDQDELVRLSVDYLDWFVCYYEIYTFRENYSDHDYESIRENRGKIFEIDRRLKEKIK